MSEKVAKVFDLEGRNTGKIRLPNLFDTPIRQDVIKRAVIVVQSHRFQPQGRDVLAGRRTTAESRGVGLGISRVARMKGRNRAAFVASAVGGRATHPPKVEKKIKRRMPRKEMRVALRSAVAATAIKETVASRGHIVDDIQEFPLVVVDEIQRLRKTRDVREALKKLGVWPDIYRVMKRRGIRAGKGKRRGRKNKSIVGPLIVINQDDGAVKAARNIPGIDITIVNDLNVELLAPGTHPGRLTVWTNSSINKLDDLFGDR
jgi:large subunit ribosomal protein L4e